MRKIVINHAAHKALIEATEAIKPTSKFRFRERETGSVWEIEAKNETAAWDQLGLEYCESMEIKVTTRSDYDPEVAMPRADVSIQAQLEFNMVDESGNEVL